MNDLYYRKFEDLYVSKDEDVGSLVNERATQFMEDTFNIPDTCFVSPDVLKLIINEFWGHHRATTFPSPNTGQTIAQFITSAGPVVFQVCKEHTNFMMIGIKDTYENYKLVHSIPIELYNPRSKKIIDQAFEDTVLKED